MPCTLRHAVHIVVSSTFCPHLISFDPYCLSSVRQGDPITEATAPRDALPRSSAAEPSRGSSTEPSGGLAGVATAGSSIESARGDAGAGPATAGSSADRASAEAVTEYTNAAAATVVAAATAATAAAVAKTPRQCGNCCVSGVVWPMYRLMVSIVG